ncbi:MAG: dihydrofolate reductase [Nitrosomonadales bacterium]|nr:dihydrofolate reductase [Nitrosomonadales bacterium]NCV38512.1 dihydrofolate reductase [Betaproteobacteria bacterium]NCW62806.1 dihydrofolate reductase [Betaproteobacteria bacterium]
MSENYVIGLNNSLPWHLSDDLKRFKEITTGHQIVMGRKTYESIGRPLPNRDNFVLTRNAKLQIDGINVIKSLNDIPSSDKKTFIIGGGEIYTQLINSCDELLVTKIHCEIDGDAYFPIIDLSVWSLINQSEKFTENDLEYSYLTYRKI